MRRRELALVGGPRARAGRGRPGSGRGAQCGSGSERCRSMAARGHSRLMATGAGQCVVGEGGAGTAGISSRQWRSVGRPCRVECELVLVVGVLFSVLFTGFFRPGDRSKNLESSWAFASQRFAPCGSGGERCRSITARGHARLMAMGAGEGQGRDGRHQRKTVVKCWSAVSGRA